MEANDKIVAIKKLTDNPFLNLFDITAKNRTGGIFHYYAASREAGGAPECITKKTSTDGIMIYAVLKEDPAKIVLIRQYRYPLNDYVYEMPAGLAEQGERARETAVREFKEETGMDLELYEGGCAALRRPFYTTVGLTDEAVGILYGFASGKPDGSGREVSEDMEVVLADREKARRILQEEKMAMKCAQSLIHFVHADPENPFAFLDL